MSLLTRKEAAHYLRISTTKLDQLAADGEIAFAKLGPPKRKGVRVLFRAPDLDEYIERALARDARLEEARERGRQAYEDAG